MEERREHQQPQVEGRNFPTLKILAILDVILRVPPVFIVDALFNYQVPLPWQTQSFISTIITIKGLMVAIIIFSLSFRVLLKVYAVVMTAAILYTSYWWNEAFCGKFLHALEDNNTVTDFILKPEFFIYLLVQFGYASVFTVLIGTHHILLTGMTVYAAFLLPLMVRFTLPSSLDDIHMAKYVSYILSWYLSIGLPLLALLNTVFIKIYKIYYSTKYALILVQHIIRNYGIHIFIEDQWRRLHVPTVLRVFWLTRFTIQAVFLTVMVLPFEEGLWLTVDAAMFWDILTNLMISGCDSTLTVLGMSAVISSIAHQFGRLIQWVLGADNDEEKHMGTVSAILFFILALQTGLSGLLPDQRLTRLYRNFCLLLTAIMHFIHNMVDPVLLALSASHNTSVSKHLRVLSVCLSLLLTSPWLMFHVWNNYKISTWLLAISAFCIEVIVKVVVSLTVYTLFMIDSYRNVFWERLDDYVYYVKAFGNSVEFIFGIFLFGNGAWIMVFESGGTIRAIMMCIHAYFNIWQQAKQGWKVLTNRRTAVQKINSLPTATAEELAQHNDVCAICYQDLVSACITPCNHYFHSLCLRKWLYIQDKCPLCHADIYEKEEKSDETPGEGEDEVIDNANDEQVPNNENLRYRLPRLDEDDDDNEGGR
ncbi:E3 ubiquitin-protein ligase RNF139-like [Glandiceps talaboti]